MSKRSIAFLETLTWVLDFSGLRESFFSIVNVGTWYLAAFKGYCFSFYSSELILSSSFYISFILLKPISLPGFITLTDRIL